MRLTINQVQLNNFKGISSLVLPLNPESTQIEGVNGVGKSTIADAISWCLFGKDAIGNTAFGIKTRDSKGNEIPHLDHSVKMQVTIDERSITIERVLREKWSKPRGSFEEVLSGNVLEYYVDGEKLTKGDFDKFINSIANEELFRLLTIPSHFPRLKWQDQRSVLENLAGSLSFEDVAEGNPQFTHILSVLKEQSMDDYRRHLAYSIKELKKKIAEMPVRIESYKQTLPECEDWLALDAEFKAAQAKHTDIQNKLNAIKQGNAAKVASEQKKSCMDFLERRIDNIRKSKRKLVQYDEERKDADMRNARTALATVTTLKAELVSKVESHRSLISRCQESIKDYDAQLAEGTKKWLSLTAEKFELDESMTICPTCGQPLPEETIKEHIDSAREKFNLRMEQKKKELSTLAENLKAERGLAINTISDYEETIARTEDQLANTEKAIQEAQANLDRVSEEEIPSAEQRLAEDENYQSLLKEYEDMATEPLEITRENLEEASLNLELIEAYNVLESLRKRMANKDNYERVTNLISETEQQWKDLNTQLAELEQKEDTAISLSQMHDDALEERVNGMFSVVKFRLFRTLVDGKTREPYCTCMVNGVPYADVNRAMKINAGIDIINTLSRFNDIYVPVVIDNAESSLNILPSMSQQILFYVSNTPELTIRK